MHQAIKKARQTQTDDSTLPAEHLDNLQQPACGHLCTACEAQQSGVVGTAPGGEACEEFDSELGTWLLSKLQRLQPGAELTVDSIKVLGRLLDQITERVLEEAQRTSSSAPLSDAPAALAAAAAAPNDGARGAAAAGSGQPQHREGQQATSAAGRLQALTSLDIHKVSDDILLPCFTQLWSKCNIEPWLNPLWLTQLHPPMQALKRVLPEPAGSHSHLLKQAWHLDKQSLKGIKRQKQAAATATEKSAASRSAGSKENEQGQETAAPVLP